MFHAAKAFSRAVLWGTFAGGAIFLVMSVPMGMNTAANGHIAEGAYWAVLPLLLSGLGTLAGAVLIGLPISTLLRAVNRESISWYVSTGMLGGFTFPLVISYLAGPSWAGIQFLLAFPGLLAGAVFAKLWGNWRVSGRNNDVEE